MTNSSNLGTDRQYYIDWLRIMLIISVFLFHIGMIFNTWSWHIKNDIMYGGFLRDLMIFLHNWRMPLLFMLSGAGTYYATQKMSSGQYVTERTKRLFIPLVIGIFTLVPVQVYIEKIDEYNSLFDFYSHMFDGVYPDGNFSWHHLWFIVYLFVIALFISPFLRILRNGRSHKMIIWLTKIIVKPLGMNIILIPLILSQLLLRPFFELETHALVNDWATFSGYLIFFLAGFILLPVSAISEALSRYRLLYLVETVMMTIIMFRVYDLNITDSAAETIYDFTSVIMSWSCALTAIGYAKRYFDFNSPLRKNANEAIYPFYLLHQPVIVITGYLITRMDIPAILKALLIGISSFMLIVSVCWFLIRPFNFTRFLFGMKKHKGKDKDKDLIMTEEKSSVAERA